jgi:hypothetical protein
VGTQSIDALVFGAGVHVVAVGIVIALVALVVNLVAELPRAGVLPGLTRPVQADFLPVAVQVVIAVLVGQAIHALIILLVAKLARTRIITRLAVPLDAALLPVAEHAVVARQWFVDAFSLAVTRIGCARVTVVTPGVGIAAIGEWSTGVRAHSGLDVADFVAVAEDPVVRTVGIGQALHAARVILVADLIRTRVAAGLTGPVNA